MSSRRGLILIIIFLLFVLILTGKPHTSPAITSRDGDIIKVAFMNGYLEAVKLDAADLEKLKNDEALLKQHIERAAARYLNVINTMNK